MNVIHLATYETSGGAGLAAGRLSAALSDSGVKSRMLVRYADPLRPRACRIKDQVSRRAWFANALRRIRQDMRKKQLERRQPRGAEIVTHYRGRYRVPAQDVIGNADVVNLHWVAEFLDLQYLFATWPAGVPIVWTLHDMNPFTGACHHSSDCARYQNSCGQCPAINSSADDDFSRAGFKYKEVALRQLPDDALVVVGPSQWISEKARESALLRRFRHEVIPNGQDLERFSPVPKQQAKVSLGIESERPIVLMVAAYLNHPPKGFSLLIEALRKIPVNRRPVLMTAGNGQVDCAGIQVIQLGLVTEPAKLRLAYSAADILAVPSHNETQGMCAVEALACGTPVVAFNVGGLTESVVPDITGKLARAGDSEDLAGCIDSLLSDRELYSKIVLNCRSFAMERLSITRQAQSYHELYRSIV